MHQINFTPKWNERGSIHVAINEWYWEKPYECLHMPISAFLSKAYSTLTRQLGTVIIELSAVQTLRLRTIPQWAHEVKYLTPTMGPTTTYVKIKCICEVRNHRISQSGSCHWNSLKYGCIFTCDPPFYRSFAYAIHTCIEILKCDIQVVVLISPS